jgi:hypothetical protein
MKNDECIYQIKVRGRIPPTWAEAFSDLVIAEHADECGWVTQFTGAFADQAALQGLLNNLYTLGLVLVTLERLNDCSKE